MILAPMLALVIVMVIVWVAAIYDWRTLTIPNYYPLIVIALFVLFAPFTFDSLQAFGLQGVSFLIALALGLVLYVLGPMGGGDIKLFAALGLWVTLPSLLPWILCITLSGLLITIIFMGVRFKKLLTDQNMGLATAYAQIRVTEIPYGPAIAMGTTIIFGLSLKGLL